jgi:hypothetical protein
MRMRKMIAVTKNPRIEIDGDHVDALRDVCTVARRWIEYFGQSLGETPMHLRDFGPAEVNRMKDFAEFILNEL